MGRGGGGPTTAWRKNGPVSRTVQGRRLVTDEDIVATLAKDKTLRDLRRGLCPKGSDGRPAPLPEPKLFRRGVEKCRGQANALQNRPVFASSSEHSVQVWVAMLQGTPAWLAAFQVRALLVVNDKPMSDMESRVDQSAAEYVGGARDAHNLWPPWWQAMPRSPKLRSRVPWAQASASWRTGLLERWRGSDEAGSRKRGKPEALVSARLQPSAARNRAKNVDWRHLAAARLRRKRAAVHADNATA